MAERVQVVAPDGTRGSVDAEDVNNLPDGARILTKQELAQEAVQSRYDALSPAAKAAGIASTVAGAVNPLTFGSDPNAPPTIAAYGAGVREGATAGLFDAGMRKGADAIGGKAAGDKYAQRRDEEEAASPVATEAGKIAGMVGASALGPKAGPVGAVGAVGHPIEAAVAKGLGGLAARGAIGKAAATGAAMAVRGAAEGAAFAGIEQAASDIKHDDPITGEKLYAAVGHGALGGVLIGGGLGVSGSLLGSAKDHIFSSLSRSRRVAPGVPGVAEASIELGPRGKPVSLDAAALDAGLRERAPAAENVFTFGEERRGVGLRPMGRAGRVAAEEPIGLTSKLTIDPDAGLHAPRGKATSPFNIEPKDELLQTMDRVSRANKSHGLVRISDLHEEYAKRGVSREEVNEMLKRAQDDWRIDLKAGNDPRRIPPGGSFEYQGRDRLQFAASRSDEVPSGFNITDALLEDGGGKIRSSGSPVRSRFEASINPDAGLGAPPPESRDIFRFLKEQPRDVRFGQGGFGDLAPLESRAPIKIPEIESVAADAGHRDFGGKLKDMAHERAWGAVGKGFGLQTSRYAKEAARYFPNGTKDLGEVAIRYGLIDMGPAGSTPFQAAMAAAKTGTVADIAPRAAAASDQVGAKIGEITAASNARVSLADVDRRIASVRREYDRIAGNEHVVSALDGYHKSLSSKLSATADGTTSVQALLEQRKGLDEIVFRETKTLDPGRRVAALRQVRAELESVITESLDAASGQVPGKLRDEYKALKKDYHALRLLTEASEDSAARASKGATLGLGEKMALATSLATGHFTTGPLLAAGGKYLKERGNAAAAAFLSRAAEQGTFSRALRAMESSMDAAALGALNKSQSKLSDAREAPRRTAASVQSGREAQTERRRQAQSVVKWIGDQRANPDRLISQIEEAAAIVGQHGGPKTAEAYTAAAMRALSFIAAHIPAKERRDPLDPRSTPPLTYEEADQLVRATRYAAQPMSVFADFERGIVTPEGLRAAKVLMPEAFAEFQTKLWGHVENHMLHNQQLTQTQRLRIDKLLGFPAGPDLKPEAIAALQANLMKAPEAPPPAGPSGRPPLNLTVQQTGFDAIEARKAG